MLTKNKREVQAILQANSIEFKKECFFNGFHGTRFIFPSLKVVRQVTKLTGYDVPRYFKQYALELFI